MNQVILILNTNNLRTLGFIVLVGLLNFCSNGQGTTYTLSAIEFDAKIKQLTGATILDVRSPEEFSQSHLAKAINIDWNEWNFDNKLTNLDKSKPILIYCLSGSRSYSAAKRMRSLGFKEVFELKGGLLKWRSANLPETTAGIAIATGLTRQDFNNLIVEDKIVLVDFYADWCGPCKKMDPYLKEIANEMAGKVLVLRINTDKNQTLARELHIDAIPVLQVYKNKKLTWKNIGYIEKKSVVKQLR